MYFIPWKKTKHTSFTLRPKLWLCQIFVRKRKWTAGILQHVHPQLSIDFSPMRLLFIGDQSMVLRGVSSFYIARIPFHSTSIIAGINIPLQKPFRPAVEIFGLACDKMPKRLADFRESKAAKINSGHRRNPCSRGYTLSLGVCEATKQMLSESHPAYRAL